MADEAEPGAPLGVGGIVRVSVVVTLLAVVGLGLLERTGDAAPAGVGWFAWASEAPQVTLEGIEDGDVIGGPALSGRTAVLRTNEPGPLADAEIVLSGRRLEPDFDDRGRMAVPVADLDDGEHELTVDLEGSLVTPDLARRWTFALDTTPPELELEPLGLAVGDEPLEVSGRSEPEASVEVNGERADVSDDGAFGVEIDGSRADSVVARAADPVGNVATVETATAWVPSRSDVEQVNGLHVSFYGWASDQLREPILEMAEQGRITTVQLDLKDEGGHVGYDTDIPRANEIGANLSVFDLEEAVAELHARGVRVVGRIVAFADPVWAEHAWEHGDRDTVVQRPEGEMYVGRYAGFTSFAHDDVRQYNIDVAEEAVQAGVDDILWDYMRRPDGPREEYYFGGLEEGTTPEESIVAFLEEADDVISHYHAGHGASVYGISATRPTQIGQDIPAMAPHLDYVSPMVYYSHWGPGEYDVADPRTEPYAITHRSLLDFVEAVDGKRARVVPWLQDFQLGGPHGEPQVRDQLRAAGDAGIDEWLMWDASVRYTREAYDELPEAPESDDDVEAPGDGGVVDEDAAAEAADPDEGADGEPPDG